MGNKSAVFIDIDLGDITVTLEEAWPDGVPDEPTADLLAEEIKNDHRSLSSFIRDWDLDAGGTVTITVIDEEGNRSAANVDFLY